MLEPPKPRTVELLAKSPNGLLACITIGPGRREPNNFWLWVGEMQKIMERQPITDVDERRGSGMTMTVGGTVLFYPSDGRQDKLYWGQDELERLNLNNYTFTETPSRMVVMEKRKS